VDRKGQIGIGVIILVAVAVIIGAVILNTSADNLAILTQTVNTVNKTFTAPAINGNLTVEGQAVTSVIATNASSGTLIPASNYTITNYVLSNGQLISTFTSLGGDGGWQGKSINLSYTYEPFGYDRNSGNRSVIGLVVVFFALAIAVVAITPVFQEKILDLVT